MSPITQKGNFNKTVNFLTKAGKLKVIPILQRYGERGVKTLAESTPLDSGKTAESWAYKIDSTRGGYKLVWTNSNIVDGVPVVILLQYGHATKSGSYIDGHDFINPALKPILEALSRELWKEVTSL